MARFVFDAFAVLALVQDEPAAEKVQQLLGRARDGEDDVYMSVVNLGEVLYTVERRRGIEAAQELLAFFEQSPMRLVDVDRPLALLAARLKVTTGIGYADCFAAACALRLDAKVVTGDKDFQRAEPQVTIEWLPPSG